MTTEFRFRGRPTTQTLTLSLACGLSALAVSWSGEAHAQATGQGTLAVGIERVFGIVGTSTDRDGNERSNTHLSFLYDGAQFGADRAYDRPRVAVDYFIIDNLSLGGALGFYTISAEVEDDDAGEGSGFLFSPRVGYMVGINERLGFWPRGGFTFVQDSVEGPGGGDVTDSASALSVEAPLYIGLAQSIAMHVALTIDLGIGGEEEADLGGINTNIDEEHTQFGLQLGMTGFF